MFFVERFIILCPVLLFLYTFTGDSTVLAGPPVRRTPWPLWPERDGGLHGTTWETSKCFLFFFRAPFQLARTTVVYVRTIETHAHQNIIRGILYVIR